MKWKWLFLGSVALNLVFAATLLREPPSSPPSPSSQPAYGPAPALTRAATVDRTDPPDVGNAGRIERKKARAAAPSTGLEVEDYPTFIRKLRAAGLSDDTIALLVVSEMFDRKTDETIALRRRWSRGELSQDEYQKQVGQLEKDSKAALKALLGEEGYRQFGVTHDHEMKQLTQSGRFSSQQLEGYFDLREKQRERTRELSEKLQSGEIDRTEYAAQMEALAKPYQEQLQQALGPELARTLRIETDHDLQTQRGQLQSLKLSDAEFDAYAQIVLDAREAQHELRSARRRGEASREDVRPQRETIEQQKKERIMALLGPQRYAEYEKQLDSSYQQFKQFGKPIGLNDVQVEDVYQVTQTWRAQEDELRRQLNAQQIKSADYHAAVEQLKAGTRDSLVKYLGAERYERMKRATGRLP